LQEDFLVELFVAQLLEALLVEDAQLFEQQQLEPYNWFRAIVQKYSS
jgi:hypothetical protein